MKSEYPIFSKDILPSNAQTWLKYQKKTLTSAIRINGPFRVITAETENEPFLCQDGYLALDASGYPYAIAKEEFEAMYDVPPDMIPVYSAKGVACPAQVKS